MTHTCRLTLLASSLGLLVGCAHEATRAPVPALATPPPVARTVAVVDTDFGLRMPDPYRWMEGENNAEFTTWLRAHSRHGRAYLDALPTRAAWRSRLSTALASVTNHAQVVRVGPQVFFLRRAAGSSKYMLMVRDAGGSERVLLDPAALDGHVEIGAWSVSPAGDRVALSLEHGGNEIGEIAVYDVATAKRLPDTLKPVWGEFEVSWMPDGKAFFYTRMDPARLGSVDPLQGMVAAFHRIGDAPVNDPVLVRAGAGGATPVAANRFPVVIAVPESRWAILHASGASATSALCVAPLAKAATAAAAWRCLVTENDLVQGATVRGDTLYLMSARNASNRNVLALDLGDPQASLARANVVVAERPDHVITEIGAARDAVYVKSMHQGADVIERLDPVSGRLAAVDLPARGTISNFVTDPRDDGMLVAVEGWTTPSRLYAHDGRVFRDTGLGDLGAASYPELISEELEATSADGTKVPLSVVRRADLVLDGHARAVVTGYAGYGYSLRPGFAPNLLAWTQAGNVFAACHARGGGEMGDGWRLAGSGPNKPRGIEDFTACAQELSRRGYATAARTGGVAGSMGGVLAGGAFTAAPRAWGAMVVRSGELNVVRLLAGKNGANQLSEVGDPRTGAGMRQLLAMDPYQHVADGTRYPPLMLVVGMVDQRVAPWQSGKFGARVAAANPDNRVVFRADEQYGHFAGNLDEAISEWADVYAFFDATLAED